MGIEKVSTPNVQQVQTQKVAEQRQQQVRDEQNRSEESEVRISDEALRLHTRDTSTVDHQKVDQIKKAIDNGSFQINSEKIAEKMHEEAVEMMRRRVQQAYNVKNKNEGVLGA